MKLKGFSSSSTWPRATLLDTNKLKMLQSPFMLMECHNKKGWKGPLPKHVCAVYPVYQYVSWASHSAPFRQLSGSTSSPAHLLNGEQVTVRARWTSIYLLTHACAHFYKQFYQPAKGVPSFKSIFPTSNICTNHVALCSCTPISPHFHATLRGSKRVNGVQSPHKLSTIALFLSSTWFLKYTLTSLH